jgi:hypothetical protein
LSIKNYASKLSSQRNTNGGDWPNCYECDGCNTRFDYSATNIGKGLGVMIAEDTLFDLIIRCFLHCDSFLMSGITTGREDERGGGEADVEGRFHARSLAWRQRKKAKERLTLFIAADYAVK